MDNVTDRPDPLLAGRYARLEADMPGYDELVSIPVMSVNEALVPIEESPYLVANQIRSEMLPITGERIYVRQTVARLLGRASRLLAETSGLQLQVGYGYRSLTVQRANFEKERQRQRQLTGLDGKQLDAVTHRYVAIPEIAGHPAGAAVDVRLLADGQPVDCGTDMWTFSRKSYTDSPEITTQARDNRLLLKQVMQAVGFTAFSGEWWHFSYGDKEWAFNAGQPAALYEQVEFSTITTPKV